MKPIAELFLVGSAAFGAVGVVEMIPSGLTPSAIGGAAIGACLHMLVKPTAASSDTLVRKFLNGLSIWMVCFFTGIFLGPSIVGNVWLLNTIEAACFVTSIGGWALVRALPPVMRQIAEMIADRSKQ